MYMLHDYFFYQTCNFNDIFFLIIRWSINYGQEKAFICLAINRQIPDIGGRIELHLFKANPGLIVKNNVNKLYSVEQYHVYKVSKTGIISQEVLNRGAGISQAAELIQNAEVGDKIYFKDILIHKLGQKEPQNWGTIQFTMTENRDWIDTKMLNFPDGQKANIIIENQLRSDKTKLLETIKEHTRVPQFIFDKKISGQVLVFFDLSEEGDVSNLRTASIFKNEKNEPVELDFTECNKEALRVLHILPKELLLARIKYIEDTKLDCANDSGKYIPVNFPK
jgi:hypothetical protein